MRRWKVPLPIDKPDDGKTHMVIACGQRGGSRIEWIGQLTDDQVKRIWEIVLPVTRMAQTRESKC